VLAASIVDHLRPQAPRRVLNAVSRPLPNKLSVEAWHPECRTCSMKTSPRIPRLRYGDRVRFIGIGNHPDTRRQCTIIRVLPNPSGRDEHQWYDVKFDDASLGRFLAKYFMVIGDAGEEIGAA
jgi:hypothetical protein